MLDWKILGASFAALIVVSSLIFGSSSGIGNIFSDIFNKIGDWLGSSPFGNFLNPPTKREYSVHVFIYPKNFSLEIKENKNLSFDSTKLTDFSGKIFVNFEQKTILLSPANSKLKISTKIEKTSLDDIEIGLIKFDNIKFEVTGINTTDKGDIEIQNFIGEIIIKPERIELAGNVSSLKTKIGDLNWKLA